jgi:adenylate cyclase
MIFSLQRRFLLFLLVPVTLILVMTGGAGFLFARKFLLEQWSDTVRLKLDKAAHQISMRLEEKLALIDLIAKAEQIPSRDVTQAFLVQQLTEKPGVLFVDIEPVELDAEGKPKGDMSPQAVGSPMGDGLYTMELCADVGFCAPAMDPNALDRSLRIVKILPGGDGIPPRRLVVRVRFNSFLEAIQAMSMGEGTFACMVTSTGQFLAHTEKAMSDRKMLGDNGDPLEKEVLKEIRKKAYGTAFGAGHPPDLVVGFHKVEAINWYILFFSQGSVVMQPIVQFRFYYALAGLVALLVIVLLIRVTTRYVGRSVAEISAAASQIQNGDYRVKLSEDRSDEIGELKRGFNRLVEGLKKRDLIEQTFGRYVDKKVAEELMNRPGALRLGGEKRTVTIMMSDLRNFTSVSEKMEPEVVIKMLNRYFARMIAVIERYRGIIVDFYGDSILVFFNGSEEEVATRALDAVRCALEMQREHYSFVRENETEGLPVIMMGIGVHTGEVVVGNIGTESRAKYGIVGSDVNLTDRIQATASAGKVIISEQTYQAISDKTTVAFEFRVCLKGVEDQKRLYELESVDS